MSWNGTAKDRFARPRVGCVDGPRDTGFDLSNSERRGKCFRGLFDADAKMNGGLDEEC